MWAWFSLSYRLLLQSMSTFMNTLHEISSYATDSVDAFHVAEDPIFVNQIKMTNACTQCRIIYFSFWLLELGDSCWFKWFHSDGNLNLFLERLVKQKTKQKKQMDKVKNEAQIFAYLIKEKEEQSLNSALAASNSCLIRPSDWTRKPGHESTLICFTFHFHYE